jgi:hypothetical protein
MKALSLTIYVWIAVCFTALRLFTTTLYLLFGPALDVLPQHLVTQRFFMMSKAFLGGLFWPVSLLLEGIFAPLSWLLYPWSF